MQLVMPELGRVALGPTGEVGVAGEPVEDALADGVGAGADELVLADGDGVAVADGDPPERGPHVQVPSARTIRSTPGAHVTWLRLWRPGHDAAARLPPATSAARTRAVRGSACRRRRARQTGVRRCMRGPLGRCCVARVPRRPSPTPVWSLKFMLFPATAGAGEDCATGWPARAAISLQIGTFRAPPVPAA